MVEEVDDLRALGLRVVGFVGFWGSNPKALRGKGSVSLLLERALLKQPFQRPIE